MSRLRGRWAPLLLVLVALAPFYVPLVGRGFASEDFLLLRFLRQHPPWTDPVSWLAGPWLGIDVVRFYRPVSTLILAVEASLFGARSWAYDLVHLAFHAANVLLVWRLAHELQSGRDEGRVLAAATSALLFALHPLHPNAVSFIASFATLFATTFVLLTWLVWRRWSAGGGGGRLLLASQAFFVLALGSYEAAVVTPLLLLLGDVLAPGPRQERRRWRERWIGWLPFALLAAGYLALRGAIFGRLVGGYPSFAARFSPQRLGTLVADAFTALYRLLYPVYDGPAPVWAPVAVVGWFLVLPLLSLLLARRGWRRETGLWILGWGWTLLALAPFAFQPFVPANGRFAYLASVGMALALGRLPAVATLPAPRPSFGRRLSRWLAAALPALVLVAWCGLLLSSGREIRRAGALARRVSDELVSWDRGTPRRAFVEGQPRFLYNAAGIPTAQVLRYGLADSVRPPFADSALEVYPLPAMAPGGWRPLRRTFPDALLLRWHDDEGRFREVADTGVPEGPPGPVRRRLIVAARGNATVVELAAGEGWQSALPREFVRSMAHLYDDEVYAWVEERRGAGAAQRVVGWTPPLPVTVAP